MVAPVSALPHLSAQPEAPRAFLGVTRSVLGRPWRERCADPAAQAYAATMVQAHGLPELLARRARGRAAPA
ncbi:single-stranded-DNA-specific exonuclease RecJ, partial [Methylobacterium sp. WL122]